MPPIDLLTAFLDRPKVAAYGIVGPVAGNVCVLQELTDKKKVIADMLGRGPWNALKYLSANRKALTLPDTTRVHFHQGYDGTIGGGMTASSTGPDQGVDAFFADLPAGLDKVTFSRYASLWLKLDPDPGAPGTDFELWAWYEALLARIFDNTGAQTSFAFSVNPAWWINDFLIEKFVKRGARINEPLTAAEKLRFDWQSFVDSATWCDADIGGGVKRWSKGGLWFSEDVDAQSALEKMLLYCQCFLLEVDGKLKLVPDQARNSAFTFYAQDVVPGSFRAQEADVGAAKNRLVGRFRDANLASGSSDELTRFAEASVTVDHKAHQLATGVRGSGLSVQPNIEEAVLDFGVCTEEQVRRRLRFELWRQLGDDVAPGETYTPPIDAEWVSGEHGASGRATANTFPVRGDRVTIDRGVSEEYALDFEILEMKQEPDGRIAYRARQYMPNAFSDAMPATQAVQAPSPGTGLQVVSGAGNYAYRPRTNPLTATDAGASATVNIAAFTMEIGQVGQKSYNSGSVASLSFDTLYFLAFKDPAFAGGTVTYEAFTTKEDALQGGRFLVGSIITPKDGGPDTKGAGDGGAGAQTGLFATIRAGLMKQQTAGGTIPGFTSPSNAINEDDTDAATSGPLSNGQRAQWWHSFGQNSRQRLKSAVLYVESEVIQSGAGDTAGLLYTNEVSLEDQGPFSGFIFNLSNAGRSKQVNSVPLPNTINLGDLGVRALCNKTPGSGTIEVKIYRVWVETED